MAHPLCPTCKKAMPLEDNSPASALKAYAFFPFCSEQCKLIDLGHWFDGNYGFSRPIEDNSELTD